ncbi:MAG: hypothetical protein GVY24_06950 [Planctomycetes bacterium]|jgi:hypothetical protein|nr:hypothetical protein [Planctomycetota bacterium]
MNRRTALTVAGHEPAAAEPHDRRPVRAEIARTSERLLPWAISLVLHVAVVLLALFVVWSARSESHDPPARPIALRLDPIRSAPLSFLTRPPVDRHEAADEAVSSLPRHQRADTRPTERPVKAPGHSLPGPAEIAKRQPTGLNNTAGRGFLDGDQPSPGRGEGTEPRRRGGRPGSVVFVIDASGSMVEPFAVVQRELGRAIRTLGPEQRFAVIYFQRGSAFEAAPRGLRPATPDNRQRFFAWAGEGAADIQPRGASNPMPALQMALAYRPDEIRLLSDNITGSGLYAVDVDRLLSEVDRIKRQRRAGHTTIHTVQFLRPDPTAALKRLAERHGGKHRFVSKIGVR